MIPHRRVRSAFIRVGLVSLVVASTACGKKGPPLAPLRPQPGAVADLRAARLADRVRITFTVPSKNQDGTVPADLDHVEIYALTGRPLGPADRPLEAREWEKYGTLVGRVDVEPPPPPEQNDEGASGPPPTRPDDPRPAQGEAAQVEETLGPGTRTPFVHPDVAEAEAKRPTPASGATPTGDGPLAWLTGDRSLERHYAGFGVTRGRRRGPVSRLAAVPLVDPPPAPPAPEVSYTPAAFLVKWRVPAGLRQPIQRTITPAAQREGWLPARPVFTGAPPHTFAVYELPAANAPATSARQVHPTPLAEPVFEDARVEFGRERCYAVRTVQSYPTGTLESPLSPVTCVTPRDTFAPAAPTNLASVGSEGGVSLIWEASPEGDVAGYHVLRGEPGQPLAQITPSPVKETTWRDTTAQPGRRYAYAVVAVDQAGNPSPESNRVEDEAR